MPEAILVGQAPGIHEREIRKPFAWTAGARLRRWLEPAGLGTDEAFYGRLYVTSVAKCFPGKRPGGSDVRPGAAMIRTCLPWLVTELALVPAPFVISVGTLALEQLAPGVSSGQRRRHRAGDCRRTPPGRSATSIRRQSLAAPGGQRGQARGCCHVDRETAWHDAGVSRAGYRELWRVPTYPWLLTAVFLARLANAMSQVAVVIYLLDRTHSPALAGAGAAAQLVPGVLVGPLAGAWLDRTQHRRRLIVSAQLVRAALLAGRGRGRRARVAGAGGLPRAACRHGAARSHLTPGFRALVPLLVPRRLWDQSNAADRSRSTPPTSWSALAGATVTIARARAGDRPAGARNAASPLAPRCSSGSRPRGRLQRSRRCRRPGRGSGSWPGIRSCVPSWPRC